MAACFPLFFNATMDSAICDLRAAVTFGDRTRAVSGTPNGGDLEHRLSLTCGTPDASAAKPSRVGMALTMLTCVEVLAVRDIIVRLSSFRIDNLLTFVLVLFRL